jgi:hypothetical protein
MHNKVGLKQLGLSPLGGDGGGSVWGELVGAPPYSTPNCNNVTM